MSDFKSVTIEANNVTGEVIFSLHEDALSSDGDGFLPLLHHHDVVLLRKTRGSPFADLQHCHSWRGVIIKDT